MRSIDHHIPRSIRLSRLFSLSFYPSLSRYSTGSSITQQSVDIHDLFIEQYVADPIHLLVDTSLTSGHIAISAVMSSPMGAPGSAAGKLFAPVECQVFLPEPERIACELEVVI